jgi:hypothetical protein
MVLGLETFTRRQTIFTLGRVASRIPPTGKPPIKLISASRIPQSRSCNEAPALVAE